MMHHFPLLSVLIWLPIFGAIPVAVLRENHHAHWSRVAALVISLICLGLCVPLYLGFDMSTASMQFVEHHVWIPSLHIVYGLGVDGISMPFIVLSSYVTVLVVIASWTMVHKRVPQYLALFLVTQGVTVGVFSATDSMLFFFFWEAMLIPMYLTIGIWGAERRTYAAIKFFLYTFFGSALMLAALLYLHAKNGDFSIVSFYAVKLSMKEQILIFFAFLLAFGIKVPMWPVHTWLPDAHTEAPVGGSVILAALMLKLGGYGFLRFTLPIVPNASHSLDWLMITLALIAIIYIGLIAIAQTDMKRLIAYSSIAHMGFVILGTFMIYHIVAVTANMHDAYMSLEGGLVQMISHAFGSGALFFAFGVLYEQMHTRNIKDFGGIASVAPYFAAFFLVFALSNVGLPGTAGFVGEFMVILSTFKASFWVTLLAGSTLVIAPAYTLWMYKRVFFCEVQSPQVKELRDVTRPEAILFVLLAFAVIWIGVYPNALLNVMHASVGHLLDLSMTSKLV